MAYYLDLFSPETYEAFSRSDRTVSGFRLRQQKTASRIQPGDKLLCYMPSTTVVDSLMRPAACSASIWRRLGAAFSIVTTPRPLRRSAALQPPISTADGASLPRSAE